VASDRSPRCRTSTTASTFDWSVDGSSVLFFDLHPFDGPMMWLADVATGDVRPLGAGSEPRWLPDGRIAFTGSVEGEGDPAPIIPVINVMDLATGERTEIARASAAAWAPDGASVLIQADEDELVMADADGSNPTPFVNGWSPVWSPDGSSVVFAYDHNADGLPLVAAVDREGRRLWSGVIGESAAWSADGTRLAVEIRYPEPTVRVIDARTGDMLWETDGSQPAWRP
jgi:Tol biopolymer transport system component